MAVKCNIPGLALQQIQGMLYGFNCNDVTFKIAENYMEYLNCPFVDHQNCKDFPCVPPEGNVTCDISGVALNAVNITSTTVDIFFNAPSQPYVVTVIDVDSGNTIYNQANPSSPILLTILSNDTDYIARLTMSCPGGESKQVQVPFHTQPICVNITGFTGVPAITIF